MKADGRGSISQLHHNVKSSPYRLGFLFPSVGTVFGPPCDATCKSAFCPHRRLSVLRFLCTRAFLSAISSNDVGLEAVGWVGNSVAVATETGRKNRRKSAQDGAASSRRGAGAAKKTAQQAGTFSDEPAAQAQGEDDATRGRSASCRTTPMGTGLVIRA